MPSYVPHKCMSVITYANYLTYIHIKVLGWKAQLEVPKMLNFFIGVSYQAFYCGSFDVKKTKFWPLDLPLEFFKIFFLIYDPHFRRKKKCSDSPENSTNRPDDIKSGPNLVSDRFFDFSQKNVRARSSVFYPTQPQVHGPRVCTISKWHRRSHSCIILLRLMAFECILCVN